jgi:hypothetical protein
VDTSHHPPKSKAPTLDHSANPEKAAARGGIRGTSGCGADRRPQQHSSAALSDAVAHWPEQCVKFHQKAESFGALRQALIV